LMITLSRDGCHRGAFKFSEDISEISEIIIISRFSAQNIMILGY